MLAKFDLWLGMEALLRARPRSDPALAHPIESLGYHQTTIQRQLAGAAGTCAQRLAIAAGRWGAMSAQIIGGSRFVWRVFS